MSVISSTQNERVKYIVKLREDKRQRIRDEVMLVEGKYELEIAFMSGLRAMEIYHCEDISTKDELNGANTSPTAVTRAVFEKMSHRQGPDGWLGIFRTPVNQIQSIHLSSPPFLVLTESVEKPGNLGAVLRTADAVGVDALIVCDPKVDLYNPNVIRASRGTIFSTPCVQSTSAIAMDYLNRNSIKIIAATPQADLDYWDIDLTGPICIAVGAESSGLTDMWLEQADVKIRIPMMGKVNSLNVSISSAIILYEGLRQRKNSLQKGN